MKLSHWRQFTYIYDIQYFFTGERKAIRYAMCKSDKTYYCDMIWEQGGTILGYMIM